MLNICEIHHNSNFVNIYLDGICNYIKILSISIICILDYIFQNFIR